MRGGIKELYFSRSTANKQPIRKALMIRMISRCIIPKNPADIRIALRTEKDCFRTEYKRPLKKTSSCSEASKRRARTDDGVEFASDGPSIFGAKNTLGQLCIVKISNSTRQSVTPAKALRRIG